MTPAFSKMASDLKEDEPMLFTEGASVYSYAEAAREKIRSDGKTLSEKKLDNSRIAITDFDANSKKALTYIKGVMVDRNIAMDNGAGSASLSEFSRQIDQRSELVITKEGDREKKKFTSGNLRTIFSNTRRVEIFEELLRGMNYPTGLKTELRKRSNMVNTIYKAYIEHAVVLVSGMNYSDMKDEEVVNRVIDGTAFNAAVDEKDKISIALYAYSMVLFEGERS